MEGILSSYIIPIAILAIGLTGLGVLMAVGRNWIKVSPNEIAIVSGRNYTVQVTDSEGAVQNVKRGYRIVAGGGFFRYPILEKVQEMSLNVMSFAVEVKEVPDKMGALVTVKGIANVKVASDESSIGLAVERFLGFNREQIESVAKENLESNLRAIVGTLTIENLIQDRQELQVAVLKEAVSDLAKMGLQVDLLNVQDVRDERGYIDSLGKKRTAEVVRDATIGEAEAKRDSDLKTAEANKLGEIAKANATQEISNAERERDVVKAENDALVQAKQARIAIAAETAAAQESQKLKVAEVEAEKARTIAATELQEAEKVRKQRELEASQIVGAEKDKEARIIAADAEREAAEREGEAQRIREAKAGEGVKAKLTAEAEGRKAAAEATQAELEAEAEGQKAKLLAEAEGLLKKARAYGELQQAGKMLMALEASPAAIQAVGEALGSFMRPVADSIGAGLAGVDEIRLVDLGNGNGNGHGNVLSRFVNSPAEAIFGIIEQFKATGSLGELFKMAEAAGFDLPALLSSSTAGDGESEETVDVAPTPPTPPEPKVPTKGKDSESAPA